MNVIFLDFDGVIDTIHIKEREDIKKKIKIVADIAKEYDCKIVIEASAKDAMNEETLEIEGEWVNFVVSSLKEFGAEVIGRTPSVEKRISSYSCYSMWKEKEIRLYLLTHPEIDHFCIIDDDDLYDSSNPLKSDLYKVRDYLVRTKDYDREHPEEEGILERHSEEVGKILKKENKYKKYAPRFKKRYEKLKEEYYW